MNLQDLDKFNSEELFAKVKRRIKNNDLISEYYESLNEETGHDIYLTRSNAIKNCCKLWECDYFRIQGVKDVIRTNHCWSKFCDNCGNAKAQAREQKFKPLLDILSKTYDLYHIVLTVPNCESFELLRVVDKMLNSFGQLYRVFRGNAKIKNLDFSRYNSIGAIRAIEITKNYKTNTMHPHLHCIFVFNKKLKLDLKGKTHKNAYSSNNCDNEKKFSKERKFSDFEILIQKLWYLKYNDIKITKNALDFLKLGYSCICENADGDYHQIFKYATKGIFKDNLTYGYIDFKNLETALHKRKIIQGYGVLNKFNFDINNDYESQIDEEYQKMLDKLKSIEDPIRTFEFLKDIDFKIQAPKIKYISKQSLRKAFIEEKEKKK